MLTLGNITFLETELDFESNAGSPVIISSFSGINLFDSYLISDNTEYKLYKPFSNNILFSYKASLIIERKRINEINKLIFEQANIVKEYRTGHDLGDLVGYHFKYEDINTFVWLTSFSLESSFYDSETGKEKIRCKLDVQEAE